MRSETHSGLGRLWKGEEMVLHSVPYSITITTRDFGVGRIEGSIKSDFGTLTALIMEDPPPKLVLELDDGRRWECYLVDNGGRLVNRGRLNESSTPADKLHHS